jgi:hypothetical protein
MSTITVTQARIALEAAHMAYVSADIEHPTATHIAKEALTNARHEYWNACAAFCTKLEFATDLADVHDALITQGLWA